ECYPCAPHLHPRHRGGDKGAPPAALSAAGVYIMADPTLAVGSPIEFDITLPANVLGTPADVEVHCTGRVIRKESGSTGKKKKKSGVACVIDQYQFIRKSKGSK